MMKKASPVYTAQNFGSGIRVLISSLTNRYTFECLKGKTGFLMISVKNPNFSRMLIDHYCSFVQKYLVTGYITIVDLPYTQNILAGYEDENSIRREIEKLERITKEINRLVEKVLSNYQPGGISLLSWTSLSKKTPLWLKKEVADGFQLRGKFYSDILTQVKRVLKTLLAEGEAEKFAGFLLDEFPVLFYIYYIFQGSVLDFYPGETPDIIWKLELGHYADELPGISKIAMEGEGLTYADFQEEKRLDKT